MSHHNKPVIGLIGGIGSGKSLVAKQLASLGAGVINADQLAHEAFDDPELKQQLLQWWGPNVILNHGDVNRKYLAKIVFDKPEELEKLEGVIHPIVHQKRQIIRDQMMVEPGVLAIVEDCPLLLEVGLDAECDVIIFVKADRSKRLERVTNDRGWTDEQLTDRENLQIGLDKKENRADYVIVNNTHAEDCLQQVQDVFSKILEQQTKINR